MNFLISQNGGGEYVVIDRRTNQVRYRGSLDGARQAQAQLTCGQIANSSASKYCERWTANQNCKKGHEMSDIVDRLRETPCNREPFTPSHADCQCRVASEAADEIEKLRERHKRALFSVECAEGYAKRARAKDEILPTVWELQNGHIRDALTGAHD